MISAFEYVTVLISIILGLGITQLLTGMADLIQRTRSVSFYLPHLFWILFVFILHIQEWWVTYELRGYHPWRLPTFLFIILYPVNLFILARILFPHSIAGHRKDMKEFFLSNVRIIFFLLGLSALLSMLYNLFILSMNTQSQGVQILLILLFGFISFRNITHEGVHKILAWVAITILVLSIAVEYNEWLIE